jgi:hypothetical protein
MFAPSQILFTSPTFAAVVQERAFFRVLHIHVPKRADASEMGTFTVVRTATRLMRFSEI